MNRVITPALAFHFLVAPLALGLAGEPPPHYGVLRPVHFASVRIQDVFWTPRIETIQKVTVPDLFDLLESQGKIDNLRIIAGRKKDGRIRSYNSPDSDIWKIMEAASYTLAWRQDAELDRKLDELIELYAEAQADDGYINQMFMLPDDHPQSPENAAQARLGYGIDQRFKGTIEQWPLGIGQLYCAGHLFEAAAAHCGATGKHNFLEIALKMADCVARRFPLDKPIDYADHPQAGIGLVKLFEVTGDRKYLELANHIVRHGHHGRPPDLGDRESWKPIQEQRKAWGHAVRINYLYSAATDLCRHLDQPDTREAIHSLWHSIVDRRIYVTGGVGGPAHAEQLADDWVLDNARCYCECCANIAHGQWNHRLNLLTGDAKFADLVEIEAYNAGLSGISLKGTEYFYTNPLMVTKRERASPHSGVRQRYLFCCPAKLPGFVAGIGRWIYAQDERGIYVNLYIGGEARIKRPEGIVKLTQDTRYPWDGCVTLTIEPEQASPFDLCLRIPGWARGRPFPSDLYRIASAEPADWKVSVNGKPVETDELERGYLRIGRTWQSGDVVKLELSMPVRRVRAHENVRYDRGRVALMRGPVIYCLEGVDHEFSVLDMRLPKEAEVAPEHEPELLGGVTVLRGRGLAGDDRPVEFTAVPYYTWQNRGVDEMAVWLIEDPELAQASEGDEHAGPMDVPDPNNLLTTGTLSASCSMVGPNTLNAVRDGNMPSGSADKSQPRLAWWPRKGGAEWVQCVFEQPETTDRMQVYWFADHPQGGCGLPKSWRLLYLDGAVWKEVANPSGYEIDGDRMIEVTFDRVTTKGLRIEVNLRPGLSGGIHEWRVNPVRNTDG